MSRSDEPERVTRQHAPAPLVSCRREGSPNHNQSVQFKRRCVRAEQRVIRGTSPPLPGVVQLNAARQPCELAGSHPEALSVEVPKHVKRRLER